MRFASLRSLSIFALAIAITTPAPAGLFTSAGSVEPAQILPEKSRGLGDMVMTAASTEEEYEFGVLFDAPGVETTYYTCTACHSEMIVAQQGLTRDGWEEMLEWMVEDQGMWEIEEPDRTEILDYLAAHYNEDRPNFPRPLSN